VDRHAASVVDRGTASGDFDLQRARGLIEFPAEAK
jgi:hypothetical protein